MSKRFYRLVGQASHALGDLDQVKMIRTENEILAEVEERYAALIAKAW
jgi:hypothetical protein